MLSFVIYFHSSRRQNIEQTIRFLERREPVLQAELVLVCQDASSPITSRFETQLINLGLDTYQKSKMCNVGVQASSYNKLAILDSDRILPNNYFYKWAEHLREGRVFTNEWLYNLHKPYTDEEIEAGAVEKSIEHRSDKLRLRSKNLFSGNTLITKADYWKCGGMDEFYQGYGHADTDMSRAAIQAGLCPYYFPDDELHLFHEKTIIWNGQVLKQKDFKILSAINAAKYLLKWNLSPEELVPFAYDIQKQKYPEELLAEFLALVSDLRARWPQVHGWPDWGNVP